MKPVFLELRKIPKNPILYYGNFNSIGHDLSIFLKDENSLNEDLLVFLIIMQHLARDCSCYYQVKLGNFNRF